MRSSLARGSAALALALCLATFAADEPEARACGGCFHPPPQPNQVESVITDHRMVLSMSTTQTVLWDQVRYSGDPLEFAWVLPVLPGARLELSRDEWIAALDASTATVISSPALRCGGSSAPSSGGCVPAFGGASDTSAAGSAEFDAGAGNSQVQVVNEDVVGPYETVTLQSTSPTALVDWLTQNGYDIPDSTRPIIAAYVSRSFDFLALKLRPGEGVRAMQPVRIVTPGADPTLPLRMVAAGVGANVGLTLYVITEGRFHPQNFPDETIDFTELTWNGSTAISNYDELEAAALERDGGRGWVTEYAGQPELTRTYGTGGAIGAQNPGLADAYFAQCTPYAPLPPCDAGLPTTAQDSGADSDGGVDASSPPACPQYPANACEAFDDLDVALTGLHASDVWVTRLRAMMPASVLTEGDLVLEPSPNQVPVTNLHTATAFVPGTDPCGNAAQGSSSGGGGGGGCVCDAAPRTRSRAGSLLLVLVTAMGVSAIGRRRR